MSYSILKKLSILSYFVPLYKVESINKEYKYYQFQEKFIGFIGKIDFK
jgi:hypothetical protein